MEQTLEISNSLTEESCNVLSDDGWLAVGKEVHAVSIYHDGHDEGTRFDLKVTLEIHASISAIAITNKSKYLAIYIYFGPHFLNNEDAVNVYEWDGLHLDFLQAIKINHSQNTDSYRRLKFSQDGQYLFLSARNRD